MAKVSVIIPARNERYLVPTIRECFTKARGEVEVVAILEGYWPDGWKELAAEFPNLQTIHHAEPRGMRPSINEGAASAIQRGAKYLFKLDAHCMLGEGYDEILKADCDRDWIVIPRRLRLDAENWAVRTDGRPPIDYHYLSFPDNVNDFGGPGLNGKVWTERQRERDKPEFEIDDEMSSQGSGWFIHADYFTQLELMDAENYGTFWNEAQEWGLKCWLSGGRVMVNKRTWYAHLHKGSNYQGADGKGGRGYILDKSLLSQGASYAKRWMFNNAWDKQTKPFKWLIEHFWPVPSWPENWEELIYGRGTRGSVGLDDSHGADHGAVDTGNLPVLRIHKAFYGPTGTEINVTELVQSKVVNGSLDLSVTNSDLQVGNPFRGQKKRLTVTYSYDDDEFVTTSKDERDWLIIGQSARYVKGVNSLVAETSEKYELPIQLEPVEAIGQVVGNVPDLKFSERVLSPQALNDKLIRRFNIPTHRLRGPMPIEVPLFHRNDLAQMFADLRFNHGAEIGVAEGNYSEVLCKANPNLHLLCVDPWHAYSGNPQNKSKEKNEYAYNEAKRKLTPYPNVKLDMRFSEDAVRDVPDNSLDFVYIDGHHGFDYVMQDIIEWSKKVRSGGIIAGDDLYYLDPKRWGAGPVEAVYAYTKAHGINPWFMINAHKSIDFFWVKA